ncbi:MAG: MotA/TolQ/ExbB proton channel family protein [Planctomycetaceae bacterium]
MRVRPARDRVPREVPPVSILNDLSAKFFRSPILWGGAAACCFFGLIHGRVISDANVVRYLAGHWVEYVEVLLFCVGLASLALKAGDVASQRRGIEACTLPPIPDGGQDPADAAELAAAVPETFPADAWLPRRLREALDFVGRTGSAEGLEDHLKYLADLDASRAAGGHGLVKFIVWAIPIMGFLGTVIGITVAIASLSPTQLENISGVVAGLGTAFDTTATALALSMILMFLQYALDRAEQRLLGAVDEAAWRGLAGRFQSLSVDAGTSLAITRLGETVARGSARLLEAQEQAWRSLERSTVAGLRQVMDEAAGRLQAALDAALDGSVTRWGEALVRAHDQAAARREDRWTAAAEALAAAVRGLESRHDEIAGQTAMIGGVVEAARDLATLERSLEANLAAVASTGRFEEILGTLSAAVQLLAARTGHATAASREGRHAIRTAA